MKGREPSGRGGRKRGKGCVMAVGRMDAPAGHTSCSYLPDDRGSIRPNPKPHSVHFFQKISQFSQNKRLRPMTPTLQNG
jgi:hypothetical protein